MVSEILRLSVAPLQRLRSSASCGGSYFRRRLDGDGSESHRVVDFTFIGSRLEYLGDNVLTTYKPNGTNDEPLRTYQSKAGLEGPAGRQARKPAHWAQSCQS